MSSPQKYSLDPLESDSLYLNKLAVLMHRNDSLAAVRSVDSVRNAKTIHWDSVLLEAARYEKELPNRMVPSVFHGHNLGKDTGIQPKKRDTDTDWMLGIILLVLALLGTVRQLSNRRLVAYLSAFFAMRFASQLQREEYAISNRTAAALLTCFVLTLSLFIYQVLNYYHIAFFSAPPFVQYLYLCAGITGIYLVKILVVRMLGFIFKADAEAWEYLFNLLLFNQVLGIFLLPVVTGIAFVRIFDISSLVYCGSAILIILFIYRTLRATNIGLSRSKFSRFYLFLYLCTLEILPILAAIKILRML